MSAATVADEIAGLAEQLRAAEASGRPIAPLIEQRPGLTAADAYRVQTANIEHRLAAGARLVGHKIGLTSAPMQQMLGVSDPDYGALLDDQMLADGATIEVAELIAPRIEPELAFVLAEDLAGPAVTQEDVLGATAEVRPALEVIDSRILDWRISFVDTVADNASCARGVLGATAFAPDAVDLAAVAVQLNVDGRPVQQGVGSAVLGHPARAVAWLAKVLAEHGEILRAGQVILSGSITAAVPIAAGQTVAADFGPFSSVEVRVA